MARKSTARRATNKTKAPIAVAALWEGEPLFSLFMEHTPAAAFLKDLQGRYVYVSPSFVELTGRAPELWLGATDEDYWPDSAERFREEDQYVIQTGQALTSEDSRQAGDEIRYFETVKFPIPGKDGAAALVAGISVDITARKMAQQERQGLLARLAAAREEERWRISRELHDDLIQRLAALAMDIGRMAAEGSHPRARLRKQLRELQRGVVQAAEAARHAAHELHPLELDDLGLVVALRSYCEDFAKREGIQVGVESRGVPRRLKREIGSCMYKVAQESLNNIARHACAQRAFVTLEGTEELIRLRVKDEGIGFRVGATESRVGLGLLSMEERVGLLSGSLKIRSQPGQGTEVIVAVPLENR